MIIRQLPLAFWVLYNSDAMIQLKLYQSVPLKQEEDGTARIVGSRISLDTIVGAFKRGATAEQIQDSFPSLSLREIYGVIAYYLEHQADVEAYLKERREQADALRNNIEAQQDTAAFREQMRLRRNQLIKI